MQQRLKFLTELEKRLAEDVDRLGQEAKVVVAKSLDLIDSQREPHALDPPLRGGAVDRLRPEQDAIGGRLDHPDHDRLATPGIDQRHHGREAAVAMIRPGASRSERFAAR